MSEGWIRAITTAALVQRGHAVVRDAGRQIVLFHTRHGIFACNNRCPHEGYPLSEGSLDEACKLTCNWHNWKFDLRTGENQYGGDRLRVYPTEQRNGDVWIDVTEPSDEQKYAAIMASLRDASDDNAYARMAREIARLIAVGGDPVAIVAAAIGWSHDRLEFGMTHAYAGAADWLALRERRLDDPEAALICLLEAIAHMADDVLRRPRHPYAGDTCRFDEDGFVTAVEGEDEAAALAMTRGAMADGLGFADMERALTRAALLHYADFGHSLIYTTKAGDLIARLGPSGAEPVLLALVRSLVFANREDLVPEFRHYAPALAAWGGGRRGGGRGGGHAARGRDLPRRQCATGAGVDRGP